MTSDHKPDTRDRNEWLVFVAVLLFMAGLAMGAFAGAQRVGWWLR